MQEIRGKRRNTERYIYQGFEYHVDTTSPHLFRCAKRSSIGCRGAAEVRGPLRNRVEVYAEHEGHDANPTLFEEEQMRLDMLDRAVETNAPLKEIFDTVCRRNPAVAPKLLYPACRSAMRRAREKIRPVIPASLQELAEHLRTYEATLAYYRGHVEAGDNSIALIFISDKMLEALISARELYVDGTFKVAPYHPPIAQLYTVHVRVMDNGIAAVYVLCSRRTRALYTAIFRRLTELVPGLQENVQFVMGDYERAATTALREVFPRSDIHGCWFHFNQALEKRWKHLGLARARSPVLALAMALPLAPADRFIEGLQLLADSADEIADRYPAVLQFMSYLRRQWSPLASAVSVHNCPNRTNNLVESFHNEAKRKLGGLHPNIWKFIEHLTQMIVDQDLDLERLRNGDRPRRARTIRNMARDTLIRDAQHNLDVGRFTLLEFLQRCATRNTSRVARIRDEPHDINEDFDQEALAPPGLIAAGDPRIEIGVRGGRRGQGVRGRGVRGRGRARGRQEPAIGVREAVPLRRSPSPIPHAEPEPEPLPEVADMALEPVDFEVNEVARDGIQRRGPRQHRFVLGGVFRALRARADPGPDPGPEAEPAALIARRSRSPIRENAELEPAVVVDLDEEDDYQVPWDDYGFWTQGPAVDNDQDIPFLQVERAPIVAPLNGAANLRPSDTCVVCLIETTTHLFMPCAHFCCCQSCVNDLIAPRCPVCNEDYESVVLVRRT